MKEELVKRFLTFSRCIAMRYSGVAVTNEELVQVAHLGLLNAINRFDPNSGNAFLSFASPTIHGELRRHFRDRVSTLRLPRGLYELMGKVHTARVGLSSELSREPSSAELADRIGCPEEQVEEALAAASSRHLVSLQAEASEDGIRLDEVLGTEDTSYTRSEDRMVVKEVTASLDDADSLIIRLRFHDELTQSHIASMIGCSQMHVSRRIRQILGRLQERVGDQSV